MTDQALISRIARVDPQHAEAMRANPTTFEAEELPFWREFRLVTAVVNLPTRPVQLRYADNGKTVIPLSAPDHVYAVNEAEKLRLTLPLVTAYARMFLTCTGGHTLAVREAGEGIRWLPAAETDPKLKEQKKLALSRIAPVASFVVDSGGFAACAIVQRDRALVEIELRMSEDGKVTRQAETVVVPTMPVPYIA
jgi:hypothetical protein